MFDRHLPVRSIQYAIMILADLQGRGTISGCLITLFKQKPGHEGEGQGNESADDT